MSALHQFVLNQCLSGAAGKRRVFRGLRKLLLRLGNPTIRYEYYGRPLRVPFDSDLPIVTSLFGHYNSNLARITDQARKAFGKLVMIDVGANIGDGVALARPTGQDRILLIEGHGPYFELLQENIRDAKGVVAEKAFVSDRPEEKTISLVSQGATARIVNGADNKVEFRTLDEIIGTHPEFQDFNVLKIDVDGFDSRVIEGGRDSISVAQPAIFFEYYPGLWTEAGADLNSVFTTLELCGYEDLVVYDNLGVLLTEMSISNRSLLGRLAEYARLKDYYYFDILAIPGKRSAQWGEFLESEVRFFRSAQSGKIR